MLYFNILTLCAGTIYRSHTDSPLSKLGLEYCKAKKLTKDLNTHSIQYATKTHGSATLRDLVSLSQSQ